MKRGCNGVPGEPRPHRQGYDFEVTSEASLYE